jgi:hypothetical protein
MAAKHAGMNERELTKKEESNAEHNVKTRTEWEEEQYVDPGLIKHDPSGVFIQGARDLNWKPAMNTSRKLDLPKHKDTWMTRDPLNPRLETPKPEQDPEAMKTFKQTHWKKPPTNDTLTGIKNLYKTDNRWHNFVDTYGPELSKDGKRGGHLLMKLRKYYSGFKQNQGKFT